MRHRWLAAPFFLLGLILLDPDHSPGQQFPGGGKGGKGGKNRGFGDGNQPGGNNGQPGGNNGQQGGNNGQPGGPGGGGPGGPGGGGRGRQQDPEQVFNFYSGGGPTIDFSKMTPEQRVFAQGRLEQRGIPYPGDNGVVTKEQFITAFNQSQAMRAAGGPGGPGSGFYGPGNMSMGNNGNFGNGQQNGFGNGQQNGFGPQQGSFGGSNGDPRRDEKKQEDRSLVAIRFGKLPDGLPDWFEQLDTDKDGNVGLYEWLADKRTMSEFMAMDLDGDGLLAPQEWLRYSAKKIEDDRLEARENGERRPSAPGAGRGNRGNGPNAGPGAGGTGNRGPWGGGGDRPSGKGDGPNDKGGDRKNGKGGQKGGNRGQKGPN